MELNLSRRKLALALLGTYAFAARSIARAGHFSSDTRSLPDALVDTLTEQSSAESIGRAYLGNTQESVNIETLIEGILGTRELVAEFEAADMDTRRRIIQTEVQKDFSQGRTVAVDGWLLSETEVMLCALAATLSSQS